MGGTSTDVSRFGGSYEHVLETETAGVTIQAPQLDINVRPCVLPPYPLLRYLPFPS
jgi:5-oxoprolinase (ATP-hydrolysing)